MSASMCKLYCKYRPTSDRFVGFPEYLSLKMLSPCSFIYRIISIVPKFVQWQGFLNSGFRRLSAWNQTCSHGGHSGQCPRKICCAQKNLFFKDIIKQNLPPWKCIFLPQNLKPGYGPAWDITPHVYPSMHPWVYWIPCYKPCKQS